ncbi:hypothetical protein ACFY36_50605 [Actinoplanes sp. NPDC000266]
MFIRAHSCFPRPLLRAVVVAVVAACSLSIAACHTSPAGPPHTATSASAVAQPSRTPSGASPRSYAVLSVRESCDLLDLDALTTALGPDAGPLTQPHEQRNSVASFVRCDRQYGVPATRSLVSLHAMVATSGSAQLIYDGTRAADAKAYSIAEVPGLAQSAYLRSDPQTGVHLSLYDGNLYLRVSINQIVRQRIPAATTSELLTAVARHVMAAMAA